MTELIGGLLGVGGAVALGSGAWVGFTLRRYRGTNAGTSEGLQAAGRINTARYAVMTRLCSQEDLEFLRTRPGFRPEIEAQFRRSRKQIVRGYLRELSADFEQIHAAARALVTAAPEQHADLVGILMRQRLAFWGSLTVVEVRLALAGAGVPRIDLRGLLDSIDALSAAVSGVAAPAAMPA